MLHPLRSATLQLLALAGMASVAALVSNALASPARQLAWSGSMAMVPVDTPKVGSPVAPVPASQSSAVHASKEDPLARPASTPGPRVVVSPAPKAEESVASNPIREISSEEAWKAFQRSWPFLDARRSAEFTEGHIAGAWSAPVWEADLEDRLISFKAARRPGPEDAIVIYCSGGGCRDSHLLAAKLLNEGYHHLLIYRDGFPAWVAQGHPVGKGQP